MAKHKQSDDAEIKTETESTAPEPEETTVPESQTTTTKVSKFHLLHTFLNRVKGLSKRNKIILGVVLVLLVIAAIPFTRYKAMGLVIKKDVSVTVTDSRSGKPVTGAEVKLANQTTDTDKVGVATFHHIKPGHYKATVSKKYYEAGSAELTLNFGNVVVATNVKATGVPINLSVINKINRNPVPNMNVTIEAQGTLTGDDGLAQVVAPPNTTDIEAEISGIGFITQRVALNATDPSKNVFTLVPAGKIYFLSKLTGKIDVVKTNLDGTERQTVLAGTGNESETDTILLASRDWKYLALLSVREKNKPAKLYLIDTAQNDKLSVIDEGKATFTLHGWLNNYFIFSVYRDEVATDKSDRIRLKSFDSKTGKLTILDHNDAGKDNPGTFGDYYYSNPYWFTSYSGVTITDNLVLFAKNAVRDGSDGGKVGVYSIKPDGSERKTIVEQPYPAYLDEYYTYTPVEIYYQLGSKYYEYEVGHSPAAIDSNEFYKNQNKYVNFVVSPDSKETFWAESRDGKNVIFLGNLELKNGKQIASLSELKPYGWFSGNYLLFSKNGSELYIMSSDGGDAIKVSDYHKPSINYNGYGYGYGGN